MLRKTLLSFWLILSPAIYTASAANDVWSVDSGPIDPKHYFGESLANGAIGVLTSPEPFQTQQIVIAGAYEQLWPGSVSCMVRSFNFLNAAVSIDGVRITQPQQVSNYRQSLSFKKAVFTASFDYQNKATIVYTLRALRHLPNVAMMEITVTPRRPIQLSVSAPLDVPSSADQVTWRSHPEIHWLNDIKSFETDIEMRGTEVQIIKLSGASAKGPSGTLSIAAAHTFVFDESPKQRPNVTRESGNLTFSRQLTAGTPYHFALVGSTITSAHIADPENEAQRLTAAAVIRGTQHLIEAHENQWAELWKSDIVLTGDDPVQRDVHSMIYHLYSFIREGSGYSISPMGMSGGRHDYLGHIFWDAETWMFPALLALRPELARSMLDYRFDRLAAARKKATLNGYRGAQFPWESATTGDEETWSEFSGGSLEIHITADIALAAWNYYRVTQDREWLRERGYPLIKETADFWTSRVTRAGPGHFDIQHVVAPDEYAEDVDNDAYTNAAAKENLAAAIKAAELLGLTPNPDWKLVRDNITAAASDHGVTREFATYRGEQVKQADVNLIAYPLQAITDPDAIKRDLDFYSTHLDERGGPAMTKSIFAILSQRLGAPERAYKFFMAGYEPNERPPFGVISETAQSDNPYFATGAGGLLQAMLYGFGGLEVSDTGLKQHPSTLPAAWKALKLTGIGPDRRDYSALLPH